MEDNQIRNAPKKGIIISVIFYILAVILLITALISLAACHQNISAQLAQGVPAQGNELAIINLYLSSCVQYFAFSFLMFFCARVNKNFWTVGQMPAIGKEQIKIKNTIPEDVAGDESELLDGFVETSSVQSELSPFEEKLLQAVLEMGLDSSNWNLHFEELSLATICVSMYEQLEKPLASVGYSLSVKPDEGFESNVFADRRIQQVLPALLMNLLQEAPPPGTVFMIKSDRTRISICACDVILPEQKIIYLQSVAKAVELSNNSRDDSLVIANQFISLCKADLDIINDSEEGCCWRISFSDVRKAGR